MRLEVGMVVLDRFRVEKLHDQGGMARVYRARHLKLGTPVALKVLSFDNDVELIERFYREAQMMAKIQHPNVVQILDFGMVGGEIPCIAMEYVEGEPLDLRLSRRGAIPWEEAIELTLGILSGLDAAHHAEVLHRDLKPENVIVVPGTPERPKLIDFGIAQHDVAFDAKLTQHGETVGTPAYMSPEQLYGLKLDPRSDVYSAGLVLYELLTQDLPNPADATEAIAIRVTTPLPYPTPPPGLPPVPRAVADAIFRALEPEPDGRPSSARQFAAELRDVRRELRRRKKGVRPSNGPSLHQPSGASPRQPSDAAPRRRPSPPPRSDTFAPTPPPTSKPTAPKNDWTPPVWARGGSRWAARPSPNKEPRQAPSPPPPRPEARAPTPAAVTFRRNPRPASQPAPPKRASRPEPSPRVTQAYGSHPRSAGPAGPRANAPRPNVAQGRPSPGSPARDARPGPAPSGAPTPAQPQVPGQDERDRQVALARVAALRGGSQGAEAAAPAQPALEGDRVRLIVVAKVPFTRLRLESEQRWLQGVAGPGAQRGFVTAGSYWVCAIKAESDTEAEAAGQRLAVQLGARYGAKARARWTRVDGPLSMSSNSLPPLVQGLMHYVNMG